ncbi:MAG: permease [Alphaproteobacteria bacterium]|jgi:uncharacterized membrane protein YraQ (UPF0718 family)
MAAKKRFGGYGPAVFVWSLAIGLGMLCYALKGEAAFIRAFWADIDLLELMAPRFLIGLLLVGFLTVLAPKEMIARVLGKNSGLKGLVIAAGAGALLPGGPWVIMPLVLTIARAGADTGACITFVVAWACLGVNRLLVWEIAFLGFEVAGLRWFMALPLPILAGLIVRRWFPLTAPVEASN